MFCQACGAKNAEGSRFCNLCGERFAAAGEPGGPVAASTASAAPAVDVWSLTPGASDKSEATRAPARVGSNTMQSAGIAVHRKRNIVLMLMAGATLLAAAFLLGRFAAPPSATPQESAHTAEVSAPTTTTSETPAGTDPPLFTGTPEVRHNARTPRTQTAANPSRENNPSPNALPTKRTPTTQVNRNGETAPASASPNNEPNRNDGTNANSATTAAETPGNTNAIDQVPAEDGASEDEASIEEEMYAVQVRRVIRTYYLPRAQSCFDHQSRVAQDSVRGTVLVTFAIQANGEVQNATVTRNTTNNDALGRCLVSAVNQWRLPAPPSAPLELAMPFGR